MVARASAKAMAMMVVMVSAMAIRVLLMLCCRNLGFVKAACADRRLRRGLRRARSLRAAARG
eukprot:1500155-Pleurochrysis_carterae.AAC.1